MALAVAAAAAAASRNTSCVWLSNLQQLLQHCGGAHGNATPVAATHARTAIRGLMVSAGQLQHEQQPQVQNHTSESLPSQDDIDFGFRTVPRADKAALVGAVFSSVAGRYDVMNDLMSGGLHRLWKDRLVASLVPFAGMQHLDVAGGTGDVAFRVLKAIQAAEITAQQQHRGHVTVFDINGEMLDVGRSRAVAQGLDTVGQLSWVQGNAEVLPFPDNSMDAYTVAFGIRNVTDRAAALAEAWRVLRPGGRLACLEFSSVSLPLLREAYDAYSFAVIPRIGALVAGDADSYAYLVESIRRFPDQETWAAQIREAGFKAVTYENMTGGVVAIHSGFKL